MLLRFMRLQHIVTAMRNFHRVLLVSLLTVTFAFPLLAFQGRPLSDLVVDDRMPCSIAAAASDGHDFLVVCDLYLDGTWGQIISGDGAAGPLFLIGKGFGIGGTSAVWNGSSYVVTWCADSWLGTYATTVSRNGSVGVPAIIYDHCGARLAANGDRVLLVAGQYSPAPRQVVGMLLDGDARPTSSPRTLFTGDTTGYDIAATNAGFALGTFGYEKTSLTRIDRDGKPTGAPVIVEGPYAATAPDYHSSSGMVASDGENVLLAFHAYQHEQRSELRTAIVAADSTIQRTPAAVFALTTPFANNSITPTSILWNGSSYVAGMGVIRQYVNLEAAWLRIDRNGERIGDVEVVAKAYSVSLASNGRDHLIGLTGTPSGAAPAAPSYALAPPDALTPRTPFLPAGRAAGPHVKVAVGAMRDQYLAAWTEKHGTVWRVRASRLDRDGRYLDGAGIILGTLGSQHSIAVDGDGTNWLVVWGSGGSMSAARISPSGRLLDAQPIDLGNGNEVSVRWGNGTWMVVATSRESLVAIPVGSDGVAGTQRVLGASDPGQFTETNPSISYTNPAVSFDGNRFLAGAIHHSMYRADTVQPFTIDNMTLRMTRVDANGQAVDGPPSFIADSYSPTLSLASNGTKSMAVFSKSGKVKCVLFPERTEIELSDSGPAGVTWDGHDFVVAYRSWNKNGLSIARITPQGVVSQEIETQFAADERPTEIVLAGGSHAPPLVGFVASHNGWNGVARASAAFVAEVVAAEVPPAPVPRLATAPSRDRVRVQWTPMPAALGISVELRLPDGTYRPIGVAASAAADAEIPLGGLTGNAIRLRAWNSAGTGEASGDVEIKPARQRGARK